MHVDNSIALTLVLNISLILAFSWLGIKLINENSFHYRSNTQDNSQISKLVKETSIMFPISIKQQKAIILSQNLNEVRKSLLVRFTDQTERVNEGLARIIANYKVNQLLPFITLLIQMPVFLSFGKFQQRFLNVVSANEMLKSIS